jgi:acyl-coenzyme A thioesterase PaaI-like protein
MQLEKNISFIQLRFNSDSVYRQISVTMVEPDLEYFQSLPWCDKWLSDPATQIISTGSRTPKSTTEDALFGRILNTHDTISRCLSFFKKPAPDGLIEELRCLLTLEPGLNGYPSVCHGGLIALIFDEIMGVAGAQITRRAMELAKSRGEAASKASAMTAELTTTYRRPVLTPQTVCVVIIPVKMEGRNAFLNARMENSKGKVLAEGRARFAKITLPNL